MPLLQTKTAGKFHIFLMLAKVLCPVRNMKKYAWFCFLGFNHCYHPSSSSQSTHVRGITENNKEGMNLYYKIQNKLSTFQIGTKPFPAAQSAGLFPPVMLNAQVPFTLLNLHHHSAVSHTPHLTSAHLSPC